MGNILNVVNNDNNKKPKPDAVLLEEVQMLTDMSESNINRLYEIWISYDTDFDGEMSQEEFLSIPEIAASPLKDRLMLLLNMASTETGSDRVTFNAFAILLSVMSIVCITFNISSAQQKNIGKERGRIEKTAKSHWMRWQSWRKTSGTLRIRRQRTEEG